VSQEPNQQRTWYKLNMEEGYEPTELTASRTRVTIKGETKQNCILDVMWVGSGYNR